MIKQEETTKMQILCEFFWKPFQKNGICVKSIDFRALGVGSIDLKLNFTLKQIV